MNATLEDVAKKKPESTVEELAAEEMARRVREQGLSLAGPEGLLRQLTKTVLETAPEPGDDRAPEPREARPVGHGNGNVRNGTRAKTVLAEASGQAGIEVLQERDGTFEPRIVKKRQRRLTGAAASC